MVLRDDPVHGGQPQPRALANFFGGEERLKEVRHDVGGHAAAIVADGEQHIVAGHGACVVDAVGQIQDGVARLDGDLAGAVDSVSGVDGVAGVDAKVGQGLVDLRRVEFDRPEVCARHPGQVDVLADQALQHLEHAGQGVVQVQPHGRYGLFAGEGEELAGDVGRALGIAADLVEPLADGVTSRQRVTAQVAVAHDTHQQVVEVVGHAARQAAHQLHLLSLEVLRLQLLFLELRALAPTDVGQDVNGTRKMALRIQDRVHDHLKPALADRQFQALAAQALGRPRDGALDDRSRRPMHDFPAVAANHAGTGSLKEALGGLVGAQHVAVFVQNPDGLTHGVEGDLPFLRHASDLHFRLLARCQLPLQVLGAFGDEGRQLLLLQPLQMVGRFEFGHGPDLGHQLLLVQRFGEKPLAPRFQSLDATLPIGPEGSQKDHRNRPQAVVRFQLPADLEAIHARHDDVEQDHIRVFSPGQVKALHTAQGGQ